MIRKPAWKQAQELTLPLQEPTTIAVAAILAYRTENCIREYVADGRLDAVPGSRPLHIRPEKLNLLLVAMRERALFEANRRPAA